MLESLPSAYETVGHGWTQVGSVVVMDGPENAGADDESVGETRRADTRYVLVSRFAGAASGGGRADGSFGKDGTELPRLIDACLRCTPHVFARSFSFPLSVPFTFSSRSCR